MVSMSYSTNDVVKLFNLMWVFDCVGVIVDPSTMIDDGSLDDSMMPQQESLTRLHFHLERSEPIKSKDLLLCLFLTVKLVFVPKCVHSHGEVFLHKPGCGECHKQDCHR